MAQRVSNPTLKMLLNYLSEDSKKHKEICEEIAKICDEPMEIQIEECQEMGGAFKESVDLARLLKEKVQRGMPLIDVMQNLIGYEEKIGEEYLALLQTRAKRNVKGIRDRKGSRIR